MFGEKQIAGFDENSANPEVEVRGEQAEASIERGKRVREMEEESRASKATGTYQPRGEKSQREGEASIDHPKNKIIKTTHESGVEVTRDVVNKKPVQMDDGGI